MKTGIQKREFLPLVGLTISAFLVNTSEFIPIGLLSDIAGAFHQTAAQTGVMITVYSWAVTILSLPLMLAVAKMDYRRLLLCLLGLFVAGQAATALAPGFAFLLLARLIVACVHSVFWAIASPVAVRIASREHQSFALSMIVTGTAIAMVLGMPLGRMLGLAFGWRAPFFFMAAAALAVLIYLLRCFPKLPGQQSFTMRDLPSLLQNRMLILIYVFVVLLVTGYYTTYSYIEPFLIQVAGLSEDVTTAALTLFGIAGLLGSALYSKYYAKTRRIFFLSSIVAFSAALLLLYPAALLGKPFVIAVCALLGIAATAFNVEMQGEIIHFSPANASAIAMAIYSAIFNLGIGVGTGFGGFVSTHISLQSIGIAGGLIVAAALLFCAVFITRKWEPERQEEG